MYHFKNLTKRNDSEENLLTLMKIFIINLLQISVSFSQIIPSVISQRMWINNILKALLKRNAVEEKHATLQIN